MAQSIKTIKKHVPSKEKVQEEELQALQEKLLTNKDAVAELIYIAKELHESNITPALHAALQSREKMSEILVGEIKKEGYTNGIKTIITLLQALGKVDQEQLQTLLNGANKGLEHMKEETGSSKLGYMDIVKLIKDPDVNRSLNLIFTFLKGMGKELKKE